METSLVWDSNQSLKDIWQQSLCILCNTERIKYGDKLDLTWKILTRKSKFGDKLKVPAEMATPRNEKT